jgi:hypothetical protein
LCPATGTKDHHGNLFNHQARTLQWSILAGHFITGEECRFHHAGKGPELQVHSIDLNAAALCLLLG